MPKVLKRIEEESMPPAEACELQVDIHKRKEIEQRMINTFFLQCKGELCEANFFHFGDELKKYNKIRHLLYAPKSS